MPFSVCNLHKDKCQTYYITHATKGGPLSSYTVVLEEPGALPLLAGLLGLGLTCLICLCRKNKQTTNCFIIDSDMQMLVVAGLVIQLSYVSSLFKLSNSIYIIDSDMQVL